jgi:hypothetical protein
VSRVNGISTARFCCLFDCAGFCGRGSVIGTVKPVLKATQPPLQRMIELYILLFCGLAVLAVFAFLITGSEAKKAR